jgi:hypothetical protein
MRCTAIGTAAVSSRAIGGWLQEFLLIVRLISGGGGGGGGGIGYGVGCSSGERLFVEALACALLHVHRSPGLQELSAHNKEQNIPVNVQTLHIRVCTRQGVRNE